MNRSSRLTGRQAIELRWRAHMAQKKMLTARGQHHVIVAAPRRGCWVRRHMPGPRHYGARAAVGTGSRILSASAVCHRVRCVRHIASWV